MVKKVVSEEENHLAPESTLYIAIAGGIPKFRFSGTWSGSNMELISRHLRRAYLEHKKSLLRGGK